MFLVFFYCNFDNMLFCIKVWIRQMEDKASQAGISVEEAEVYSVVLNQLSDLYGIGCRHKRTQIRNQRLAGFERYHLSQLNFWNWACPTVLDKWHAVFIRWYDTERCVSCLGLCLV